MSHTVLLTGNSNLHISFQGMLIYYCDINIIYVGFRGRDCFFGLDIHIDVVIRDGST